MKCKNRKRFTKFFIVMVSILAFALYFGISNIYKSYAFSAKEGLYVEIVVEQGDSLWSIAKNYSGKNDVRKLIFEIERINKIEQEFIFPGQELLVPVIE